MAGKPARKEDMNKMINARKMDEQELAMVSGGRWSTDQLKDIINMCIKDENHSCTFDGVRIQFNFSTKAPIVGDMMPQLIQAVGSGELAKFSSRGVICREVHSIDHKDRSITATFFKE